MPKNSQNDCMILSVHRLHKERNRLHLSIWSGHVCLPSSHWWWMSVCPSWRNGPALIFVDPGMKISDAYYHDVLMTWETVTSSNVLNILPVESCH